MIQAQESARGLFRRVQAGDLLKMKHIGWWIMTYKDNWRNALIAMSACALLAACTDTSIDSPGELDLVDSGGSGGGGGGGGGTLIDLVPSDTCPTGTRLTTVTGATSDIQACELTGNLLTSITLTAENGYVITGPVFIGQDDGPQTTSGIGSPATLTIEPGTTIFGSAGSDYIVVTRGSEIVADGTSTNPIIFTSRQDIEGTIGENDRGLWGGLVINGRAPINACIDGLAVGGSADCEKSGEGSSGLFGGDDPTDSSGTIRYAVVKYAGFKVNASDELNGIAFQGVGSGTTVDYVQIHNNADDGVEFFGGTVNVKHLVLTGIADDSLDWTDGWQGHAQFVLVKQASDDSDNGFEMDNRSSDNTLLPRSNPAISNFTVIGQETSTKSDYGLLIRAGTAGTYLNGIAVNFNDACLDIDDAETFGRIGASGAAGDEALVMSSMFFDCPVNFEDEVGDPTAPSTFFAAGTNNTTGTNTMSGIFPGANELSVAVTDPTAVNAFFDAVTYIGAFGPTETETSSWASGWTFGLFPPADCPTGTTEAGGTIGGNKVCQLTGNVTSDLHLVRGPLYELLGPVFVGVDRGPESASPLPSGLAVTMSIDAGTTIFGSAGSDYIVVTRGSKIEANGTSVAPITMTSRADVEGTVGINDRGQWGGLVINGRAKINACIDGLATGGTADCEKSGEGSSGLFGGGEDGDDSGHLFYLVVKHAGFKVNASDELNGIAFQGVGSGTEVDYVQIHNNADDGIEFFGGAVNAKHLVLTGIADDSMDWTDGWHGKAQYVIVQQSADDSDNGFEMDNRGSDNTLLPRSNPQVANFTVIGSPASAKSDLGLLIRAGTAGHFMNGLVVDFNDACMDIDDAETGNRVGATGAVGDEALLMNSVLLDCATDFKVDADQDAEVTTLFASDANNDSASANTLTGHTFITGATGVVPGATEAGLTAIDPNGVDTFFDAATYVGAVANAGDTWWMGWTFSQ